MTDEDTAPAEREPRLPRRDFVLLPLVVLATLAFLAVAVEGVARVGWPDVERDGCQITGPSGARDRPNCTARTKIYESPWIDYSYNDCGYRASQSCAPKAPGALRLGIIGTSVSNGFLVPYPQSLAGRVEHDLQHACPTHVDVQTVGLSRYKGFRGSLLSHVPERVAEALAMRPDALVTVIVPYDLEEYTEAPSAPPATTAPPAPPRSSVERLRGLLKAVSDESRATQVAQHYFYRDLDRYLPLYLKHGDAADFLRPPFTPAWRARLAMADRVIAATARQAQAAHTPFIVVFFPSRAQAALSWSAPPPGVDPTALGRALGEIARRDGAAFVDVSAAVRSETARDDMYYTVNGHPTGLGHRLMAQALDHELVSDGSAFGRCRPAPTSPARPA